jgi:multiple sugar transport system permease protein
MSRRPSPAGDAAPAADATTRQRRFALRPGGQHIGYLFIAPALIFLLLVIVVPILDTAKVSLETIDYRERETRFVGLAHYAALLGDPTFWHSLKNTLLFALGSTVGHVVLGTLLALMLSVPWASQTIRNVVRGLLILPWLFSLAAAALIWGLLYDPFGPFNYLLQASGLADGHVDFLGNRDLALWYLVVINVWKFYPFYMVMILGGLQSIPQDVYEAAKIDGAGAVRTFWHITLPLLRPVLIAATTIDMITTFAAFDLIKIMTNGGPQGSTQTLALYIWATGFRDVNLGYGAAMSVTMLVLLTGGTLFYLRLMVRRRDGEGDGSAI